MGYLVILLLFGVLALLAKRQRVSVAEMVLILLPGRRVNRGKIREAQLKQALLVFFVGDLIAFFLWIGSENEGLLVDNSYILRKEAGEGSRIVSLTARKGNGESALVEWTVAERRYEAEKLELLYKKLLEEIEITALADNLSWDEITKNLNLPERVEGYPFTLEWESDNYNFLTGSGQVAEWEDVADREETSALVELTMSASYFDFYREEVFYAKVCPEKQEGTFEEEVRAALQEADQVTAGAERFVLPVEVDGEPLLWQEIQSDQSLYVWLMGGAAAVAVWFLSARDRAKEEQKRFEKMEEEYPAIISKLTLYLGAGMQIKGAFSKTAREGNRHPKANPVYGEMCIACREMEGGIPEAEAYERFGKRIRRQRYLRLTTLLVQNLKKGNAALLTQLRQEAVLALEDRAAYVRKKGEETGTKLLLPMMLLMGMVMVLIMVPAFLSF